MDFPTIKNMLHHLEQIEVFSRAFINAMPNSIHKFLYKNIWNGNCHRQPGAFIWSVKERQSHFQDSFFH